MPAVAGGVQITATDGGAGNRSTSATTGCPCSSRYFGLTGHTPRIHRRARATTPSRRYCPRATTRRRPQRTWAGTTHRDGERSHRLPAVTKDDPIGMRHGQAIRRSTRTPSIGEAHGCLYAERPTVRPTSTLASWACNTSTEAIAARRRAHPLGANGAGVQRDAASASSKVRIYRSHGETLRELHGATRQHAKGDRNSQHACTTRMAQANAHALRNCAAVYGIRRDIPANRSEFAKRDPLIARRRSSIRHRESRRKCTNKTVRRPHGRSHRQSVRER